MEHHPCSVTQGPLPSAGSSLTFGVSLFPVFLTYFLPPPASSNLFHTNWVRARAHMVCPSLFPPPPNHGRGRQWDFHPAERTFSKASVHLMSSFSGQKALRESAHFQENGRCVGIWELVPSNPQRVGRSSLPGEIILPCNQGGIERASTLSHKPGLFISIPFPFVHLKYFVLIWTNWKK